MEIQQFINLEIESIKFIMQSNKLTLLHELEYESGVRVCV